MIRVQREDFDVGREIAALVGLVRDMQGDARDGAARGTRVGAMTLEHYPGMTEKKLAEIEAEANARWPLEASLVIHRYGRLEPGDRIVLVACASPHRDAAFDACRFLIDWLKTEAPFWKLEETDEAEQWVEARDSDEIRKKRWLAD
mgnify:CR=1 FL=1